MSNAGDILWAFILQKTLCMCRVDMHAGSLRLSNAMYLDICTALRPDALVALADEVPVDASAGRVSESVDRSLTWLDATLDAVDPGCAIFAPVLGAGSAAERRRSAAGAASRTVAGFALCGFGTGVQGIVVLLVSMKAAIGYHGRRVGQGAARADCGGDG